MSTFRVALKKTVDDSYEIEVGRDLAGKLAEDLKRGLVGGCRRFALITDSNVEKLYAEAIRDRLVEAGFERVLVDVGVYKRIYKEIDEFYNPTPIFTIAAYK